jgi:hypothetical protein
MRRGVAVGVGCGAVTEGEVVAEARLVGDDVTDGVAIASGFPQAETSMASRVKSMKSFLIGWILAQNQKPAVKGWLSCFSNRFMLAPILRDDHRH